MKLSPYPGYKASGVQWLGDVPEHWDVKPTFRLTSAIQTGPFGSQLHESDYVEGGIPLINPAHIIDSRVVPDDQSAVDEATASRLRRHRLFAGDIIMGRRGEIGRCSVVSERENGWLCGTGSLVIRFVDGCPNYFARIFSSAGFSKLLELNAVGTTMLNLNPSIVGRMQVPVPTGFEQHAIADFLDRETAKLDTLLEKKRALIGKLKEKRAALISRTVTRGLPPDVARAAGLNPHPKLKPSGVEWLGEVPEYWVVCKLNRVTISRCDGPFGSGLKSEHYSDEGVRVIRLQNIRFARFDDADKAFIDPDYYLELGDHDVHAGDVLIAGLGDDKYPVGRACVAPATLGPAMVKADCFRFRLDARKVDAAFAALQLSAVALNLSGALATGTTRGRMNLSVTADRAIALPSLKEQRAIANYLDNEAAKIDRMVEKVETAIERLREYRSALITAAVTGKIDVRGAVAGRGETIPNTV